jgi:heme/copper-type cytochrome/quinol oxidase subunit 3
VPDFVLDHDGHGLGVADARRIGTFRLYMGATIGLGFVFLVVKYFEYSHKFHDGPASQHQQLPRRSTSP